MKNLVNILKEYKVDVDSAITYGKYIAKIKPIFKKPAANKKLILVTATSPTPAGEGKTTVSIGLNDGLNKIGKSSIVAIREPSMGPVFGAKGGANGGGKSQVVPKEDIDFHFTGDMHAITAANNLIAACVDNEIYWNSSLNIDPNKIIWKRVVDMNDRGLRQITVTIDPKKNITYKTGFDITAASELMAIFCLSKNIDELTNKINNIVVAYTKDNKPVCVKQLGITNAILKILHTAFYPNAVQSLEGNLALIHGGPFANIAHGCNTIIATNTAMNIADYTVTEAGFASELGAEKFIDIVTNELDKFPNAIVLVTSLRSLKLHGGQTGDLSSENIEALKNGFDNLQRHINNIKNFNIPFVVAINQFHTDTKNEINTIQKFLTQQKIPFSLCTNFANGSKGTIDLAKKVVALCNKCSNATRIYELTNSLKTKVEKICKKCYGARKVVYSDLAQTRLKDFSKLKGYYVCMAKVPGSLTDDPTISVIDKPFDIHVKDIVLANGAKFIILLTGSIFRMPGLSKEPQAKKM